MEFRTFKLPKIIVNFVYLVGKKTQTYVWINQPNYE